MLQISLHYVFAVTAAGCCSIYAYWEGRGLGQCYIILGEGYETLLCNVMWGGGVSKIVRFYICGVDGPTPLIITLPFISSIGFVFMKIEAVMNVTVRPHIEELRSIEQEEFRQASLLCLSKGDPGPDMSFLKVGNDAFYKDGRNVST